MEFKTLEELAFINPDSIRSDSHLGEIEYIDIQSVGSGYLIESKLIPISKAPSRARRLVKKGDTILSTVRPNRRSFLYIKETKDNLIVSTGFAVLRPKNGTDSKYLYYAITEPKFTEYLTLYAKGAAYPAVDTEIIKKAKIPFYPFETQRKIAAILSAYDDLIENNTRRIQILEEMTQRIYQEWFVNFRFPGHEKVKFIDSELGKIPEGWEVSTLENIAELVKNKFVEAKHNNLPLLDLARIPRRSLVLNEFGKNDEIKTSRIVFKDDEILFGAIRPYFHKVIIAPCDGVTNTSVFVIRNKDGIGKYFLFSLLFSDETVAWTTQYASGTKMPVISWEVFKKMKVIIPQREIVENFELSVGKIFTLIKILNLQNIVLRTTRDLLLPKLISGELDVSNLDITVKNGI